MMSSAALLSFILFLNSVVSYLQAPTECSPTCRKGQQLWFKRETPQWFHNGCGPDHYAVRSVFFADCCTVHDACMSVCGANVRTCDDQFEKCIHLKCNHKSKWGKKQLCYGFGTALKKAISSLATCQIYNKAQDRECECLAPANFTKRLRINVKNINKLIGLTPKNEDPIKTAKKTNSTLRFLLRRSKEQKVIGNTYSWQAIDWINTLLFQHYNVLVPYNGKSLKDTAKRKMYNGFNKIGSGYSTIKKAFGFKTRTRANQEFYDIYDIDDQYDKNYLFGEFGDVDEMNGSLFLWILLVISLCFSCIGCIVGYTFAFLVKRVGIW